MNEPQLIEADWTWVGDRFEPEVQVVVDAAGTIEHVGALDARPTHRLHGRALLPGFVNAHSHAFQRGLRGRTESFPRTPGTFWTWRDEMYHLAESLDADRFFQLTRQAFREMLSAGISTVGEFHYLHHDATCDGYGFDELVLEAARDAGIRLVLLQTYYRTGGIGAPLAGGQRRFHTPSIEGFWRQLERVAANAQAATQSVAVAAHSIRAVPLDDLVELHAETIRRGHVFHVHVEEQQREITECVAAYGKRPMSLLLERLEIGPLVTAIHCTHTDPGDLSRFIGAGGNVCVCPLTEGSLGDGIGDSAAALRGGGAICVGTDANSRLCMTEELRWLEYAQRLRHERRGLCTDDGGSVARALLHMATRDGARSLGVDAGAIQAGRHADFVAVDLGAPPLSGWTPETLLDSLIFGTGNEAIASVCVAGHWSTFRGGAEPAPH